MIFCPLVSFWDGGVRMLLSSCNLILVAAFIIFILYCVHLDHSPAINVSYLLNFINAKPFFLSITNY